VIDLMRRQLEEDVEFATIMWFDDLESVKAFAGEDHEVAPVPERARAVLSRFDERSAHYEAIDHRDQTRVSLLTPGRFDECQSQPSESPP
jgi:hypothetical protein